MSAASMASPPMSPSATCGSWRSRGALPKVERGRRMLAEALFERIDVLGFRELTVRLTDSAIAHGFADALPPRLELFVGSGRGERDSPATNDLPYTMRLAEPPAPLELVRSA